MSAIGNIELAPVKPRLLVLDEISAELYVLSLRDRGVTAEMVAITPMPGMYSIMVRRERS